MSNFKDLTGKVFGRLTVVSFSHFKSSETGKTRYTMWNCVCSCKDKTHITASSKSLQDGTVKSCGCLRKEMIEQRNKSKKRQNSYDLSGEFGIGRTLKGEVFWFDKEDYNKIKDYCWYYDHYGYLRTNMPQSSRRSRRALKFHSYVFGDCPNNMVVDHIVHPPNAKDCKFDNRKANLRLVTKAQNAQNQVPLRKNNTSGHKGVSKHRDKYWRAKITSEGKDYIKYFPIDQYQNACDWYDDMSNQLHGEFQYQHIVN